MMQACSKCAVARAGDLLFSFRRSCSTSNARLISSNSTCHSFCSHIAKNAMSLLERFDVGGEQISGVFMNFYGRIAWHFEPFQVCGDNLRRGFAAGLSSGSNRAFYCSFHVIKTAIISGEKLASLLKEIDYYLNLLETYKSELMKNALLVSRETVSVLLDKGHATSIEVNASNDVKDRFPPFFHQALRAYWQGHGVRCHHFFEKCSELSGQFVQINPFLLKFYHGKLKQ